MVDALYAMAKGKGKGKGSGSWPVPGQGALAVPSSGKGAKDSGGKGKGTLVGFCNCGGKSGHRKRERWALNAEMAKIRGLSCVEDGAEDKEGSGGRGNGASAGQDEQGDLWWMGCCLFPFLRLRCGP